MIKLERDVSIIVGRECSGLGGSLCERVARLERTVAAIPLSSTQGTVYNYSSRNTEPICFEEGHTGNKTFNAQQSESRADVRSILSQIVNPNTKRPYNQVKNDRGFCFGDKVYSHNYKFWIKTWEWKKGYVIGHSAKMVWISEEPIISKPKVYQKHNHNVTTRED